MKKVITYGTYDLLHQGHINLLRRAKELGDYLIVGVTTDSFDLERGKLNVCNNVMERIEAVKSTGLADQIVIEEYVGQKIDDIQKYDINIFAIGSDWEGKFDYLNEYCSVVYLPRTEGISSTLLREIKRESLNLGIVGTGNIARRFVQESHFVSSLNISAAYNVDIDECKTFCKDLNVKEAYDSFTDFLLNIDAAYVASPHLTHYTYTKQLLNAGKHVLCETPFTFSRKEVEELYEIAESNNLILMVALKTAYCPAFNHLVTLLKSGVIGEIVDINASVTTLLDETSQKLNPQLAGGSMSENACFPLLPIFRLLGTDYLDLTFYSRVKNNADIYTKALFLYANAVASFQVGLGVKTEGNMVISGTKGYVYVPAPWWKTDFFEVRYEDQNRNRKFFYPYEGEGLRYEIKDFVMSVMNKSISFAKLSMNEILRIAEVQEDYVTGNKKVFII